MSEHTQADRAHELLSLLPTGPVWDTQEGEALYSMVYAISGEALRIEDAGAQHLQDFMPDTCGETGTYIDDWARVLGLPQSWESDAWDTYSDEQKQAEIIAQLQVRSDPNLPNLEAGFRELFLDETATLTQREMPDFLVGSSTCGDPLGAHWQGVWHWRYMEQALSGVTDADDFSQWDTHPTVTANQAQSPTHIEEGSGAADLVATGILITAILGTVNGSAIRFVVWYRSAEADNVSADLIVHGRDDDPVYTRTLNAKPDLWQKVVVLVDDVGEGSSDPSVVLNLSGDLYMAGAYAGVRKTGLEGRAQALSPLVTTGEFMVKGEDLDPTPEE